MSKKKKIVIAAIAAVLVIGLAVFGNYLLYENVISYTQVKIPYSHDKNTSKKKMAGAEPGDIIIFGSYEQDNKKSNGEESIEWIVLSNNGSELFVLSKYALDWQFYNEEYGAVTWENCTLREWLNDDFYNAAFSSSEKSMIKTTYVVNNDNREYGTEGGNDTWDKIFLLSLEEVTNRQLGFKNIAKESNVARECAPTAYAGLHANSRNGPRTSEGYVGCAWWLRSPGYFSYSSYHAYDYYAENYSPANNNAAYVSVDGYVFTQGAGTAGTLYAVRPAMILDLNP